MPASEQKLGKLHEQVATALTEQVAGYMKPVVNAEGEEVGEELVRPSPALLTAAISFLKNNNITADPTENAALSELNKKLAERRKGKLGQDDLDAAAIAYAEREFGRMQ